MILEYVKSHHECRYIFLSSGAAYGSSFERPVGNHSVASIAINDLLPQDWYAVSKLYAECRHRALPHLKIVDIRIFNYFSHTQDLSARFFITDLLRAIKSNETFLTSPDNIVRDYIGPDDFYQLIDCIMKSSIKNDVVDCCSKAPIDKFTLLKILQKKFQLKYEFNRQPLMVNATGIKANYYSVNKKVLDFGYQPRFTSLDLVVSEIAAYLTVTKPTSA
jgi:nucleoside-diphosphate-sugar epimerase